MSAFQLWLFRWVVRDQVTQGYEHPARIRAMYAEIRKAARAEFYEDNDVTLDSFLAECFEGAGLP